MAKARDAAPVWPPTRLPCGMAGELDHLLEGRAVGPPHGVADESRGEADPRRLRSPGRRIKPLGGGELGGRRLHRGPQRRPARIQAPVAAIPPAEGALDRRAQRGPEILVDVPVRATVEGRVVISVVQQDVLVDQVMQYRVAPGVTGVVLAGA